jgi:putative membrane protein
VETGRVRLSEGHEVERRTRLAGERTQLAWWRTGLTSIAVGVGIGRIIPELDPDATEWPYIALGLGFALYGAAMIGYGVARARSVEEAVARGGFSRLAPAVAGAMAIAGVVLALATCGAILFG